MCKKITNYKNVRQKLCKLIGLFISKFYKNKFSTNEWIETLRLPVWLVILLDCEQRVWHQMKLYRWWSLFNWIITPVSAVSTVLCNPRRVDNFICSRDTPVLGSNYAGVPAIIKYKSHGPSHIQHSRDHFSGSTFYSGLSFFVKSFMQVLFYKYSVFFIFFPLKMPRHHSQSRRKEVKYNCNQCDYQATRRVGLTANVTAS